MILNVVLNTGGIVGKILIQGEHHPRVQQRLLESFSNGGSNCQMFEKFGETRNKEGCSP